jgi:hypothetical protein
MKSRIIVLALLLLSIAILSGCTGSPKEEKASSGTTQALSDDVSPDEVSNLTDLDIPLMEENNTVEIGEMI